MPLSNVKSRIGTVISRKMDKTAVVAVEVIRRNSLYGKAFHHTRKYKAHDETNQCQAGDTVKIVESRPLSKEKRWRVVTVLARGVGKAAVRKMLAEEAQAEAHSAEESKDDPDVHPT